jgi:probable F420-dependent oxidoreductase
VEFGASIDLVTLQDAGGALDVARGLFDSARHAEELGFDAVWVNDHLIFPQVMKSTYPGTPTGRNVSVADTQSILMDALTQLAALCSTTRHVKLGTKVLVLPYRHPLLAAKMLATIDVLSGGRLIVGAGVGWMREEFDTFGAASYEHRGSLSDEYIRIFREVWTQELPAFEGHWYRFSGFGFQPKPVQSHVPIWIGGHSDAALRRVARLGDGWLATGMGPEMLLPRVTELRRLVEHEGRAWHEIALAAHLVVVITPHRGADELEPRSRADGGLWFEGSTGQLIATLRRLVGMGVTHVSLDPTVAGDEDTRRGRMHGLASVAREVLPTFR